MFLSARRSWYDSLVEPVAGLAEALRLALEPFEQIRFAVLFGSGAAGRLGPISDLDVGVYLDTGGRLEVEGQRDPEGEAEIQVALERATDRNVDLLVLNRASAMVCAAAMTTGRPVLVRDGPLFRRYYLAVTDVAARFLDTEREFRAIRSRSASLSALDRSRLERTVDFVQDELLDQAAMAGTTLERYRAERRTRRDLDRWVETLITATIDIGKVILASLRRPVPQTYGQILADLEALPDFSSLAGRLQPLAGLRNVMAHEYLDLRWTRVKDFVSSGSAVVGELAALTRAWLSRRSTDA